MKKLFFTIGTLFLFTCCIKLNAQDNDAAQKAWMEYSTPGDVHKMLAKADGQWKDEVTMWMAPGTDPMQATLTTTNKMLMGGRYQHATTSGTMMGMPFEGTSVMGYDNAKKKFVSTWIDNMGTGIMYMEGTWDDATKSITLTGTGYDPTLNKDVNMKQVYKFIDDNTQTIEMYSTVDGKEFKTMEIKSTRM